MNYHEVLSYLYATLPVFHRVGPAALKPGLDNTLKLCEHLHNPEKKFPSVHIAGTNGKGSTSHMLAAICQSAGLKTGLYTSPHLKNFTERIKVNGEEMPEADVVAFVNLHKDFIESVKPSFFEVTVAMAFDHFARYEVDIAIIETGLGGRLDSTNVISPVLSLITNISPDHQSLLGNTLPEIAREKAGIIKQKTPVVISESQREIKSVFLAKAEMEQAPVYFADEQYTLTKHHQQEEGIAIEITNNVNHTRSEFLLELLGKYQFKNVLGVLSATELLRSLSFNIPDSAVRIGLSNVTKITGLKGRWQILNHKPYTVCDTAHNAAGISYLIDQLDSIKFSKLYWVIGMVNDKDCDSILSLLPKNAYYLFCQAKIPRALSCQVLMEKARLFGLSGEVIEDVNSAYLAAKTKAKEEDMIMIGGSIFVVAEIQEL